MNIREAKGEIIHTLQAYHRKDADGRYTFPQVRQRPILLMGPPGIGKTAIMEQIAAACGVGLVAYTITHHTRQSAIGLPKIVPREYGGRAFSVTEYTMSEIIASVYDCMERTGYQEGILFIDEINCVSETLAPTMLQFLQNKTFGSHRVPEGWMIVAAGNPPQYNKSVREFDIVTLDRVRRIDVEADLDVWLEYGAGHGVHGAILSYLTIKREHFYLVDAGDQAEGRQFVTARGWEDLSELLKSYEEIGVAVDEKVVLQYLQNGEVARSFAAYYLLYRKYGTDYGIAELLQGTITPERRSEKVRMAQQAAFDERLTVIGLLLDGLGESLARYEELDRQTVRLHELLVQLKREASEQGTMRCFSGFLEEQKRRLAVKEERELITEEDAALERAVLRICALFDRKLQEAHIADPESGMARIRALFDELLQERRACIASVQAELSRAFGFAADCFGEEQELLLLVTGLTRSSRARAFIRMHGCPEYLRYAEALLTEETEELRQECRRLLESGRADPR